MTEEEIIARFYEDIKTHKEEDWFHRLFELPSESTYGEFFDVLPEPFREYAMKECIKSLDNPIKLETVFDHGFIWNQCKHGDRWGRLHNMVTKRLSGSEVDQQIIEKLIEI